MGRFPAHAVLARYIHWDSVDSIPFYAIEPKRAHGDLVPIYADQGQAIKLTAERPNPSVEPLFYALSSSGPESENSCIVPLYEFRNSKTGQSIYSTESAMQKKGWIRTENPLCQVWKVPSTPPLIDHRAKSIAGHW